ncbi:MAG: molybdate ABC transporter substrate-binding protein [Bryobacteraceae bacterium]
MTFKQVTSLVFVATLAFPQQTAKPHLLVAAASNLTEVAKVLGARFETETGIHAVFSFGSTAQLTQQIENGAPFDAFLAADAEHVQELDRKGLLVSGSGVPYADGVLALWVPSPAIPLDRIEDLASPQVRVIAVAKPELAPYGAAAMETLRHAGILDKVGAKIVYSDNINMAKQYGESGNADAVFTAYSLVLKERGKVIRIDEKLHRPITQELGVIGTSTHKAEAAKFADFILHGKGRAILSDFGYRSAAR